MRIRCVVCRAPARSDRPVFRCRCGGTLEVVSAPPNVRLGSGPLSQVRYLPFYPVQELVSLGEGGTPLLPSVRIGARLGIDLHFKNEAVNPTGSFKDRGSSVEVAKARDFGATTAVCASTGNMGASVAAYTAVAGIRCTVVVPADAAETKIAQIRAYGARVVRVRGSYNDAANLAERRAAHGAFLLGDYLYRREGTKSLGFELAEQVQADAILVPIGNGVLMAAIGKAYREFATLGLVKKTPRLIGVQAAGSSTVSEALLRGHPLHCIDHPHTVASAIEVGCPLDGKLATEAIRESRGFACTVTDREILAAQRLLAREEGLSAEPGGAASLAGLLKVHSQLRPGSTVVCLVTGHGLKGPPPAR
ncbi:MAG: threonine synthase [Candidatus Aenigmarchaeota archaeon]|nr:threonine synthase [Candidatus Aenigmarchaeota archaeon]